MKEMFRSYFQATGRLPAFREPTEEDWKPLQYLWVPSTPEEIIRLHPNVDKIVILGIAPQDYTDYTARGTVDLAGVTEVPGPPNIEETNDYIAAVVKEFPDKFIGFAAVNPKFRGVKAAVKELDRAVTELGLSGLKLYPCYDHYSVDDRELAFPIFEKAEDLGIPVLAYQAAATAVDVQLKYAQPFLLDEVGREFRKLITAHMCAPWVDESLLLLMKHPNFYSDMSYFPMALDREELYRILLKCMTWGVPLSKLFWATDYLGFELPVVLLEKMQTVNEESERLGKPKIPEEAIVGIVGGNFAKMMNIEE